MIRSLFGDGMPLPKYPNYQHLFGDVGGSLFGDVGRSLFGEGGSIIGNEKVFDKLLVKWDTIFQKGKIFNRILSVNEYYGCKKYEAADFTVEFYHSEKEPLSPENTLFFLNDIANALTGLPSDDIKKSEVEPKSSFEKTSSDKTKKAYDRFSHLSTGNISKNPEAEPKSSLKKHPSDDNKSVRTLLANLTDEIGTKFSELENKKDLLKHGIFARIAYKTSNDGKTLSFLFIKSFEKLTLLLSFMDESTNNVGAAFEIPREHSNDPNQNTLKQLLKNISAPEKFTKHFLQFRAGLEEVEKHIQEETERRIQEETQRRIREENERKNKEEMERLAPVFDALDNL